MNYGFDIDGVICKIPWFLDLMGKKCEKLVHIVYRKAPFNIVYNLFFRKINPEVRYLVNYLKNRGDKITIISAIDEEQRQVITNWLKNNRVYFDKLVLKDNKEEPVKEYKYRKVIEESCYCYFDDRERTVEFINSKCVTRKIAIFYNLNSDNRELFFKFIRAD